MTLCNDRKHRAVTRPELLDGIGASAGGFGSILEAPRASGSQRWKFAKAVAGDHVRHKPHFLKHTPRQKICEVHRPLRVPDGSAQTVHRLPGNLGKRLEADGLRHRIQILKARFRLG